jgi:hypothetical protein
MDEKGCPHEHTAKISSHADPVGAARQGEQVTTVYVCSARACCHEARQWVHARTNRGVTYWSPLRDLEVD